jgi:hypothetical protein
VAEACARRSGKCTPELWPRTDREHSFGRATCDRKIAAPEVSRGVLGSCGVLILFSSSGLLRSKRAASRLGRKLLPGCMNTPGARSYKSVTGNC